MLSPSEYDHLCDQLITLYNDLDNAIIEDMVRHMIKMGRVTETTRWQARQLQEAGFLYDDILFEIAQRTDATEQQVRTLFEDAGVQSIRNDNRYYRAGGLEGIIKMSDAAMQTLNAGFQKCNGDLKNLTLTTANTSQTAYINACNQAYMQVTSGAFSYQQAIKQVVQNASRNGTSVLYPSGHVDRLDVAVRRSVLTGVGQTVRHLSLINANDMGCDLMEITAHSGARPSHAVWQGKIVSLSGRKGYLSTKDIGYGSGDGFGGYNCRHDWYPFFEGISKPAYTAKELEKLDERKIMYNGRMYNEYEISQIQRRYEREIRSAKREQVAFKTALEEANDPDLKQVMQDSLNYANSLVKDRQTKMRDFIRQTGQDRDYFREQNYPKENQRNSLTSVIEDGKILDRKSGIYVKTKYYDGELKHYTITDERINSIKPVKLSNLSEENNKKLTSACKELLSYVRNESLGTEALMAFDMNMNEILRRIATENNGKVSLRDIGENNCIVIHNHPDGLIFSEKDLQVLYRKNNIHILGAVGNDGSIYFVEKTKDFDEYYFKEYMNEIRLNYLIEMPPEEHIKFIEEVMEGSEEYGVKFYTSKN